MLTVACYLWTDEHWRHGAVYKPEHVFQLQRMVERNLTVPHKFACITDFAPHIFEGTGVRHIELDKTTHIPNTEFVKLMTFHPRGADMIGERVLQLDLDTVIVGNIDSIVNRTSDLVLWHNPSRIPYDYPARPGRPYYNGSVILHRCGTMPRLWEEFNSEVPFLFRDTQVWMSAMVGPNVPYWDHADGIYRLAREDTPGSGLGAELPENAKIVTFVGSEHKPWIPAVRAAHPWIKEFWPEAA